MKRIVLAAALLAVPLAARAQPAAPGQGRDAAALGELVSGLGVSARVLVIGAHPDDEENRLLAWLARGRHTQTAYLSLTRGDGGQNLIGPELGEALGAIRTEELLAARRVDGATQYFARAYDFGFSKTADETFRHWPHDSVLGDVVEVVRAFRPHVVIAIWSGTPADGHGHHTAAGIVAREAYDVAGDTTRFPERRYGAAWTVPKFYRLRSYRGGEGATLRYGAGEYAPLLGASYAELAAYGRAQHKSQAQGALRPLGASVGTLRREGSRVNEGTPAEQERGLFDGIDTTWARLRALARDPAGRAAADSLPGAVAAVQRQLDLFRPEGALPALARVQRLIAALSEDARRDPEVRASAADGASRVEHAIELASGAAVEATVEREVLAVGDTATALVTVYNRGRAPLQVEWLWGPTNMRTHVDTVIAPDSARSWRVPLSGDSVTGPWWLAAPRSGDMFTPRVSRQSEELRTEGRVVRVALRVGEATAVVRAPVVRRFADQIEGERRRPLAVAPAITMLFDHTVEFAPANAPVDRPFRLTLRSAATSAREVRVSLALPAGLVADSAARTVTLPAYGATRVVAFRVRGRLAPGRHRIGAVAESGGERFTTGYTLVDYDHIRPQRLYRDAVVQVEAVDAKLPPHLVVAYIPGASDSVAPMLRQLGVPLTVLKPADLAGTDLSRFTTVVLGPRLYESSEEMVAYNSRLLDFVRGGGTMVVQYGQTEMTRAGLMPYPITLGRPADRVTDETAAVTVLKPDHPLFTTPNRITARDFEGWVQERATYMPRTFAEQYVPLLSMSDPGEPALTGGLLVARYGRGTYVYAPLVFFRELPAGVPGAARLFLNLLGAGQTAAPAGRASGR